ncbi:hypothetical protein B0H19DRAFT_871932, partial [Mycena capillaripes]
LVIMQVGTRLITARLLRVIAGGVSQLRNADILIPQINITATLPSGCTLLRRRFPLAPAYVFNSCQGWMFDILGVDLTQPVFSHIQLYTALSRVQHRNHAMIRLRPVESTTTNVTYHETL